MNAYIADYGKLRTMTMWKLPDGWTLEASTEQIEVTRDGTLPPYKADVVRRFAAGQTVAWLTGPEGQHIDLPVPFTIQDVEQAIGITLM